MAVSHPGYSLDRAKVRPYTPTSGWPDPGMVRVQTLSGRHSDGSGVERCARMAMCTWLN